MAQAPRPVPPPLPSRDQVPAELLPLRRWCGWEARFDESRGKWRKPPRSTVTGEAIAPTIAYINHWVTFDEALTGAIEHKLDGVGFIFAEEDPYVGIDFDDCVLDGIIQPAVSAWLQWLPSYAELSPSGTGVHVLGKGKIKRAVTAQQLPNGEGATFEAYNHDRYFTFSGNCINDVVDIADVQTGIDKLLQSLGAKIEGDSDDKLSESSIKRIWKENLKALKHAKMGEGNSLLNSCAFFAGRAAAVLGKEDKIKQELLDIVTNVWEKPHDKHGARETINSGWRSGAEKPFEVKEDDYPQVLENVEKINQRYFLVKNFGGKARVCHEARSPIAKGEAYVLHPQPVHDWQIGFLNQRIVAGAKANGDSKYEDLGSIWLKHPFRREYDRVVFRPNWEAPPEIFNLWKGFAYTPKKGNCSRYLDHLYQNICQNDDTKYKYLVSWMAYAVRHPDEQGHVAIVLQGLKGVGKNCAAEPFSHLFGQHGLVVSEEGRLTRNFNSHLRDKVALICDEAFFAGDRRHEGVLKSLITGSTITIEAKGVDVDVSPNLLHIIILGNADWLVPASWEERRFLMMSCGSKYKQNQEYFKALWDQLRNGGYEALLYHLLYEVDLTKFNVRDAPHTAELREQMSESLRGVEMAWWHCLYHGSLPAKIDSAGNAELRSDVFLNWARKNDHGWKVLKPQHLNAMLGVNPKGEKLGFEFQHAHPLTEQSKYWVIPPLQQARKIWNERRYEVNWPRDGKKWDSIDFTEGT